MLGGWMMIEVQIDILGSSFNLQMVTACRKKWIPGVPNLILTDGPLGHKMDKSMSWRGHRMWNFQGTDLGIESIQTLLTQQPTRLMTVFHMTSSLTRLKHQTSPFTSPFFASVPPKDPIASILFITLYIKLLYEHLYFKYIDNEVAACLTTKLFSDLFGTKLHC